MNCRFCHTELNHVFCALGHQPPSNSFLTKEQLDEPETYYPLRVMVCDKCWLVQLPEIKKASEIFNQGYVYYSSESPANVSHAKEYVEMMCKRFGYGTDSKVMEIGSNDGYLLQWFAEKGCSVLGYDPAEGPARTAVLSGIPTLQYFFSSKEAFSYRASQDLICGINVLAHQPDINDFVEGLKIALKPSGVITMEFPHLMKLVEGCQFDTIYAEHYSYFSFMTICEIFHRHKLAVFDVDEIPEHGGSLRIYAKHEPSDRFSDKVAYLLKREQQKGMSTLDHYKGFQINVDVIKGQIVHFLIDALMEGAKVCAYGAAAKGVSFLNYCGIRSDLIPFVVDRSPYKIGKYLPGSHIPVVSEDILRGMRGCYDPQNEDYYILHQEKPDYILILPWNLKEELMEQLSYIRKWGGCFITAIPKLEIL